MSEYVYGTDGHEGHWLTGEEIVRCRDCKHWQQWIKSAEHECWATGEPYDTGPDGFCAWGERKQD